MITVFRRLVVCWALVAALGAHAQWVAFNDHVQGAASAPNATFFNPWASLGPQGGLLKNVSTGATLAAGMSVSQSLAAIGGTMSGPTAGTPAYDVFSGAVDFGQDSVLLTNPLSVVSYAFTNLNPARLYSFKGTAVRGGAASYANRWTLFELQGADSFASAHTWGCLTNGTPGVTLAASQTALNTGINTAGFIVDWEAVAPGADGAITVYARKYSGAVPGGASDGSTAYGLSAFRLEELSGTTNVQPPQPQQSSWLATLTGTSWRYDQTGRDLGTAWRAPSYDDSTWASGRGVFGLEDNNTLVTALTNTVLVLSNELAQRVVTYYFRTHLTLTNDPAAVTLTFSNLIDDAAVVWLNGTELYRMNLNSGAVAASTLGITSVEASFVVTNITPGTNLLLGDNVLAVEAHQAGSASSDAVMGLAVYAQAAAAGPVAIIGQPQDAAVLEGQPAVLSVQATGYPITFQWRKEGVPITGATNASYSIAAATPASAGLYTVWVSGATNSLLSAVARLTVYPEYLNRLVTLTNTVWRYSDSGANLGYLWKETNYDDSTWATGRGVLAMEENNATVTALTNTVLRLSNALGDRVMTYYFRTHFTLTNTPSDLFLNLTNLIDDGAVFYLNGAEIYRLNLPTGPVTAATAASAPVEAAFQSTNLFPGSNLLRGDNVLAVEVHQPAGASSDVVMGLALRALPLSSGPADITQPPSSVGAQAGETAVFRVTAAGLAPLSYRWSKGGVALNDGGRISGAATPVLTLSNVAAADAGIYTVTVANSQGGDSASATLEVFGPPVFALQRSYVLGLPGGDVAIQAAAVGSEPMTYQWRFNGASIPQATNAVLMLRGVGPASAGSYSVVAVNPLGTATSPGIQLILSRVSRVIHISIDGLGAVYLANALQSDPTRYPNFQKLQIEGAWTFNARCDYFNSVTLPNHASMLTGRPVLQPAGQPATVHHGYIDDGEPGPLETLHNSGNLAVPYKASVLDVAHDYGRSTGFYAGKGKFVVYTRSYDADHGAPDVVSPDSGSNKVDYLYVADTYGSNVVSAFLSRFTNGTVTPYTFIHLPDPDLTGHQYGWGSASYYDALRKMDAQLGRILGAIQTHADPASRYETALLLTADHGGGQSSSTIHWPATYDVNYTIPLFAWGPGFSGGLDLYDYFSNRADPGVSAPDYNAPAQPLRNGDTGNLSLALLGLPPIPGSTLIPVLHGSGPVLAIQASGGLMALAWPPLGAGYTLERTAGLGAGGSWTPVTSGIATNDSGFSYGTALAPGPVFYRLRK